MTKCHKDLSRGHFWNWSNWLAVQHMVRYHGNDYSVPVEYGHRQVLVKAFVWEVVISCASEVIARHTRSYGRGSDHPVAA